MRTAVKRVKTTCHGRMYLETTLQGYFFQHSGLIRFSYHEFSDRPHPVFGPGNNCRPICQLMARVRAVQVCNCLRHRDILLIHAQLYIMLVALTLSGYPNEAYALTRKRLARPLRVSNSWPGNWITRESLTLHSPGKRGKCVFHMPDETWFWVGR